MRDVVGAAAVLASLFGMSVFLQGRAGESELRRDYHRPKRVPIDTETRKSLHPRVVGKRGRYKIVLVRGTAVRDRVDPDFIGGGNPGRYAYVPMDEVWIDDSTARGDKEAYVRHECLESNLMLDRGLSYSEAHGRATKAEIRFRKRKQLKKS